MERGERREESGEWRGERGEWRVVGGCLEGCFREAQSRAQRTHLLQGLGIWSYALISKALSIKGF